MCCIISITQTTVRIIMLNIYERYMNDIYIYIYEIDISAIPNADRSAVLEVCPNALRIV